MTPLEVYNSVAAYQNVNIATICDVKAVCKQYQTCNGKSKTCVLDFDPVAQAYAKAQTPRISTPQSVDAIAIDQAKTMLILIEKKTWEKFLDHLSPADRTNPVSAALAKLQGYDLQGKYKSTRIICEYITKEADLFLNLPHVFIFLTEFTDKNPMGGFADMMIQLATTSSQVDYSIQQPIVEGMRTRLQTISCSNSRYLNCMELDAFIKNPF